MILNSKSHLSFFDRFRFALSLFIFSSLALLCLYLFTIYTTTYVEADASELHDRTPGL